MVGTGENVSEGRRGWQLQAFCSKTPPMSRSPEKVFWCIVGGLLAFQLLYLAFTPYDLSPDEAYYWAWAKRLAWGYFSKPPLVAAIIHLSTFLGGDSPFFVRLAAPLLSFATHIALFYLARGLFGPKVALWSFLLAVATAATPTAGLIMTIDPPLLASWAWCLLLLWWAFKGRARYWYLSGVILGLGLLSKYTMGALVPSVFAYMFLTPRARIWLRRREPYLWLAIGTAVFLPHLWWEWRHGLIAFRHTASLVEAEGLRPYYLLEFLGTQFGLLTPLTFCLVAYGLGKGAKEALRGSEPWAFPFWAAAPLLGLCLLISLTGPCYANWGAPAYIGGFVLASAAVQHAPWSQRRKRRWLRGAVALGGGVCVLIYGMDLLRFLPIPQAELPTSRVMGWKALGEEVAQLRGVYEPKPFVISKSRRIAAELAFYSGAFPRVYQYNPTPYPRSQFDLWGGLKEEVGSDAIFVTEKGDRVPEGLLQDFAGGCEPLKDVEVRWHGRFVKGFSLYLCRGFNLRGGEG